MKPISRREMLSHTGLLASSVAAGLTQSVNAAESGSQSQKTPTKAKVIVTGGHPGDPEYGCGGTIARYTDLGHEVVLLYLNEGEPPDNPPAAPKGYRVAEAKKACEVLKARPVFAPQIDGRSIVDPAHYDEFRAILENEKPDVVFTHWPIDNHRDHRAISLLVYDAWQQMGKKFAIYYYEVSNGEDTLQFQPTHYVNITATEARKRQACYAHASQSPDRYYSVQSMVTRMRGLEIGHEQAEAYIRLTRSPDIPLPA